MKAKYETSDGITFESEAEASAHEAEYMAKMLAEQQAAKALEDALATEKAEKERIAASNTISVMDQASVAMITFPRSVLEEDGVKALKKQLNVKSFSEKNRREKEPVIDFIKEGSIASFNPEYLTTYLNFMKKHGATHVEIAVKNDDPIRITAETDADLDEEDETGKKISEHRLFRLWLAPYMSS